MSANQSPLTQRVVKRRDSATALLRKLGVLPADYHRFIEARDGEFIVLLQSAERWVLGTTKLDPMGSGQMAIAEQSAEQAAAAPTAAEEEPELVEIAVVGTGEAPQAKPSKPKANTPKRGSLAANLVSLSAAAKAEKAEKAKAQRPSAAAKLKAAAKTASKPETVSDFFRRHILAGKSNAAVWELAVKEFGLDDKKRYYPAWYRRELRLKGHNV